MTSQNKPVPLSSVLPFPSLHQHLVSLRIPLAAKNREMQGKTEKKRILLTLTFNKTDRTWGGEFKKDRVRVERFVIMKTGKMDSKSFEA